MRRRQHLKAQCPNKITWIVIGAAVLLALNIWYLYITPNNNHSDSLPASAHTEPSMDDQTQVNNRVDIDTNVSSPIPLSPCSVDAYPEWAVRVIRDELGDRLLRAMYDPEYLVGASISAAKGVHLFPIELGYHWSSKKDRYPPTIPSLMRSVPGRLLMLKRCMSLGLGRMIQDGRLAEDYRKILTMSSVSTSEGSPSTIPECGISDVRGFTPLKLLAKSIRAMARAYGSYTVTFLQLIVDGEKNSVAMTELMSLVRNKVSATRGTGTGAADGKTRSGVYNDENDVSPDPLLDIMGLLRIGNEGKQSDTTSMSMKMRELLGNILKRGRMASDIDNSGKTQTDNPVLRSIENEAEVIWDNRLEVLNALYTHRGSGDSAAKDNTISTSHKSGVTTTGKHSSGAPYVSHMRHITHSQYAVQYVRNNLYGSKVGYLNGRFWNSIRPVLGCSTLTKLCEEADGCRYFCNLNYLLGADTKLTSAFLPPAAKPQVTSSPREPFTSKSVNAVSSDEWRPYYHQVIGFGSHNQYDWEEGLVEAFDRGQPHANRIGKMTIFDCTIKKWKPPAKLTGVNATDPSLSTVLDFGHVTFCIGANNVPRGKGLATIDFGSLKKVLTNKDPALARALGFDMKRYNSHTVVDSIDVSRNGVSGDNGGEGVDRRGGINYGLFDEVSIMKLDVEGYEHVAFPPWVSAELEDIGTGLLHQTSSGHGTPPSAKTVLFFDKVSSNMFTISHMGMEFHRVGLKTVESTSYTGALRAHYLLMHLYALGFVMIAQEKNPFDYCCYELAFVHYRHYARSEGWQAVVA